MFVGGRYGEKYDAPNDCKFDNIYNSDILTLQIAVGKDVKVGIPTIFEGF